MGFNLLSENEIWKNIMTVSILHFLTIPLYINTGRDKQVNRDMFQDSIWRLCVRKIQPTVVTDLDLGGYVHSCLLKDPDQRNINLTTAFAQLCRTIEQKQQHHIVQQRLRVQMRA